MADFASNAQVHGYTLTKVFLSLLLVFAFSFSHSQNLLSSTNKKAVKLYRKAQEKAKERDFETAIDLFRSSLKADPLFSEAYLRKGGLYNAMGVEDSVYTNLKKYLELSASPVTSIIRKMVELTFKKGHYDECDEYLNQLLVLVPELNTEPQIHLIKESVKYAQDEISKNIRLDIVELPNEVNKFKLQYLPSITIDKSMLVYTKRDFVSGDEDIVVSSFKNGNWTEARSISSNINSQLNEGAASISADGMVMILTSCDKRDSKGSCDLYISRRKNNTWSRPKNLGASVNSYYWESQPSLSSDGKTLYFSSNRPGGKGKRDIWVTTYSEGKWKKPENLKEES